MKPNNYQGKTCAVLGLARAGIPAARFLAEQGARVIGYDSKPLEKLNAEARALADIGVELRAGEHGFASIETCDIIVLSPGLKIHHEPLRGVVAKSEARGAEVIGELELASRHCPAPIIAVTGTKGKSTTVKLIAEMLGACGHNAVRAGNTGIPLIAELPQLTPESWAIVEVSSFQLERAPTFRPRVAMLLSLLADHQDYHPNFDQYWGSKLKLFANQGQGDTAIFNLDDPRVRAVALGHGFGDLSWYPREQHVVGSTVGGISGLETIAVGRNGELGWLVQERFVLVVAAAQIPLRGAHNLSNVAAALAAVWAVLGVEALEKSGLIGEALRRFESLPHRLEIVSDRGGVTWVNDSQATIPDATIRALAAFAPPLTLIAGGRAKLDDADSYRRLGEAIVEHASILITIGQDGDAIADAARDAGFEESDIVAAELLNSAVATAAQRTPPGGTVLLSPACASFDQFKDYEERGFLFKTAILALPNAS